MAWNRPNDNPTEKPARELSRPLWLRGALAGLCVVALAGAAIWFLTGGGKSERERKAPRPSGIKDTKPAKVRETQAPKEVPAAKAVPAPELPMPRLSKERIEKRENIPAPQPLAEMEAALTNKPPKRKAVFKTGAEQLIALATPSAPGVPVPPLPPITDESVAKEVEAAMTSVIKAEEGDTESVLERKLKVATAKEEFRELREKEGWTFTQYVNALREQANLNADFLSEAHKMSDALYHDDTVSDEDYKKYRDQINAKLRERGLPEIETETETEEKQANE